MFRRALICICMLIGVNVPMAATAGLLDSSHDISIGIDPATRDWINSLVGEAKAAAVSAVDQAMSRVDLSVEQYIAAVSSELTVKIIEVQCAVGGASKTLAEELGDILPWNGQSDPIVELDRRISEKERQVSAATTPRAVRRIYASLSYFAQLTACQTQISPEASKDVKETAAQLREKWLLWNRLFLLGCANVTTCAAPYKAYLAQLEVDPRDAQVSEVTFRLGKARIPGSPVVFFNLGEYDAPLRNLLDIERRVVAATAMRLGTARSHYAAGLKQLQLAAKAIPKTVPITNRVEIRKLKLGGLFRDFDIDPKLIQCITAADKKRTKKSLDQADKHLKWADGELALSLELVPSEAKTVAAQQKKATVLRDNSKKLRAESEQLPLC